VTKCLEREILMSGRIRKFPQRAHQYVCAFYKIAQEQEKQEKEEQPQTITHFDASPIKVEKIVKLFKTHRWALDFDTHFCKAVFIKQEE
jgi:hypothetical protein